MTPKEKGQEIFDKYYILATELNSMSSIKVRKVYAKQCALIAVDFAIEAIADCSVAAGYPLDEYMKIKEEINKL